MLLRDMHASARNGADNEPALILFHQSPQCFALRGLMAHGVIRYARRFAQRLIAALMPAQ